MAEVITIEGLYSKNADNWISCLGARLQQQTPVWRYSMFPKIKNMLKVIAGTLINVAGGTELGGKAISRQQRNLGRVEIDLPRTA